MPETLKPGNIHIYKAPNPDGIGFKTYPVLVTSLPDNKGEVQGIPGLTNIGHVDEEPYQFLVGSDDLSEGQIQPPMAFFASIPAPKASAPLAT